MLCWAHGLGKLTAGVCLLRRQSSWEPPIKANWLVIVSQAGLSSIHLSPLQNGIFLKTVCMAASLSALCSCTFLGRDPTALTSPNQLTASLHSLLMVLLYLFRRAFNATVPSPSTLLQGWVDCAAQRWSQTLHGPDLGVCGLSWWWAVLLGDTLRPLCSY